MRSLSAPQQAQLRGSLGLIWFVKMVLDDVTLHLCTNAFDYDWDGITWKGLGAVAFVEPFSETSRPEATAIRIGLSGVPEENISLALQTPLQGRTASVYCGLLDGDTGEIVGDAVLEFEGEIDTPTIQEGPNNDKAMVYITVESPFADYARPLAWRYTDTDHQSRHAPDKFFQYVAQMSEKILIWPGRV